MHNRVRSAGLLFGTCRLPTSQQAGSTDNPAEIAMFRIEQVYSARSHLP